ncbi:tRNA pseudouridine(55) synthase TruB [Buchnera aphidicola]|uniref:tRNA pseudouridine(55) synthase TruB n=1 Tax=Buchnera aphidicola TaxID=9 RepID=UPI003463F27B
MYKNDINGILLLDKPKGMSSNIVLQKVKRMFNAKKAGYSGTLDKLATGILPICFGKSTKFSEYLINSKKLYHTVAIFGKITATHDSDSMVLEERKINFSSSDLYKALKLLKNQKIQIIPSYSSKKYKGIPLYKYARNDEYVPVIHNKINIYQIECIKYNYKRIELNVLCSKGTYIRKLVYDLGILLKCGAHIVKLRRLKVSDYDISDAISFDYLYNLRKSYSLNKYHNIIYKFLLSMKDVFFKLPEIFYSSYEKFNINNKFDIFKNIGSGIFRVTIKNNLNVCIICNINHHGRLTSYKLLNML